MGTSRFSPGGRRERDVEAATDSAPTVVQAEPAPSSPSPTETPAGVPIRPDLGPPGAGAQPVDQAGSGLGLVVSVAVSLVVFVLAIYASGQATANRTPLLQTTNGVYWFVAALAVVGAGVGAQYAERVASRGIGSGIGRTESTLATAWIVPSIATASAVLLVATFHNALMMAVGPLVAFLGNAGALLSRDLLDDAADSSQHSATVIHTLVVHSVAFLALSAVYLNKLPTPVSATLVAMFGGLLILETLERGSANRSRRVVYALLGSLAMAQATIALNWWLTHGWTGGAVLLVCFYLAGGVLLAATQRSSIRSRDLVEFGLVGFVALAILAITA